MDRPRLILASQSPRRRDLLARLGIPLEIRPAAIDEAVHPGESPRAYVARVAREKARAVPGAVVLAADTTVVLDGEMLGKPEDAADAARMLRALSGARHEVLTAVCVRSDGPDGVREHERVVATEVRFRQLGEREIAWYVGTGEPFDKAGGYAVQGAGGALVESIAGSPSGAIGLPLTETLDLLAEAGFVLPWSPP